MNHLHQNQLVLTFNQTKQVNLANFLNNFLFIAPPKKTPTQDKLNLEINLVNEEIIGLMKRRDAGMLSEDQEKMLSEKKKRKKSLEASLAQAKNYQRNSQKYRTKTKESLQKLLESSQEARDLLKNRKRPGRPRLEVDQPDLLKAICDIALHGSAADCKKVRSLSER